MHTVPKFTVYMKNDRIIVIKVFPGISRGGIGQGGKYREIPPGKYRPGISRTTLTTAQREVKEAFRQGSWSMNVLAPNEAPPESREP